MVLDIDTLNFFKAQSDDDDVGPDDVAVNVEGRDGFMDAFFGEVKKQYFLNPIRLMKVLLSFWVRKQRLM